MFHLLWNIRHFYDGPDGAGPGPAPSSVCDCCEPGVVVGQHPDCVKALWEVGVTFILITIMMTRMVMTFTQTDDDGDNDDDGENCCKVVPTPICRLGGARVENGHITLQITFDDHHDSDHDQNHDHTDDN